MNSEETRLIYDLFMPPHLKPEAPKTIHAMAGIPAAGKSTFVDQALANGMFPQNAFLLDPDRVMNALPAYQTMKAQKGDAAAFAQFEMPARTLAYDMLEQAMEKDMNVIIDMGNVRQENLDSLAKGKAQGYALHLYHIECPPEEAIRRAALRDRHTPPEMIWKRHAALEKLLPTYRGMADHFQTYRNDVDGQPFQKYAS